MSHYVWSVNISSGELLTSIISTGSSSGIRRVIGKTHLHVMGPLRSLLGALARVSEHCSIALQSKYHTTLNLIDRKELLI